MNYQITITPDATPGRWIVGLEITGKHTKTTEFQGLDSIDSVVIRVAELMQTSEVLKHPTMENE